MALHYLDRYSATEASLRAVLNRRIRKSATLHEPDPDIPAWVDALLEDMKRLGFINDEAFAQTRAVSLHRSGKSARAIRQTLVGKGIRGEALDRAMAAAADELGHGRTPAPWIAGPGWSLPGGGGSGSSTAERGPG